MPWEIKEQNDEYCVVKKGTDEVVKCHTDKADAEAHIEALYANVDDVQSKSMKEIFDKRLALKGGPGSGNFGHPGYPRGGEKEEDEKSNQVTESGLKEIASKHYDTEFAGEIKVNIDDNIVSVDLQGLTSARGALFDKAKIDNAEKRAKAAAEKIKAEIDSKFNVEDSWIDNLSGGSSVGFVLRDPPPSGKKSIRIQDVVKLLR